MQQNPRYIFMIGRGGSGKDTQSDLLLERLPHAARISIGDLYRGARSARGQYGKYHELVRPYIQKVDEGGLFPDAVVIELVKQEIATLREEGVDTFLFPGTPRTVAQAREISQWLATEPDAHSDFLYYAISDETSFQRAGIRRARAVAKGEEPRKDDLAEVITERLRQFHDHTPDILMDIIDAHTSSFHAIAAEDSIEDVYEQTITALGLPKANEPREVNEPTLASLAWRL